MRREAFAARLSSACRTCRTALHPLLDFLFPSACFACHRSLGEHQRHGACLHCWSDFKILRPPLCSGCGLPRPEGTDLIGPARGRCAACILQPPPVDGVRAVVAYDALARSFVLRAKLGRRPELLAHVGRLMSLVLEHTGFGAGCTTVVPVPSHAWMDLRRGFSPALELARPVAAQLQLPLRRSLRRRLAAGPSSKRLGAGRRRARASGAFRVKRSLVGAKVLLVDDVMTTGATVESCALALKAAGAEEVRCAVWARTLKGVKSSHQHW